jgi:hypothetical protein
VLSLQNVACDPCEFRAQIQEDPYPVACERTHGSGPKFSDGVRNGRDFATRTKPLAWPPTGVRVIRSGVGSSQEVMPVTKLLQRLHDEFVRRHYARGNPPSVISSNPWIPVSTFVTVACGLWIFIVYAFQTLESTMRGEEILGTPREKVGAVEFLPCSLLFTNGQSNRRCCLRPSVGESPYRTS